MDLVSNLNGSIAIHSYLHDIGVIQEGIVDLVDSVMRPLVVPSRALQRIHVLFSTYVI